MRAGRFSVRYGGKSSDAEGDLWAARVHAEYRFTRNLGMGAAIDAFQVNVEARGKSWQGEINYRDWGPQLYLQARF